MSMELSFPGDVDRAFKGKAEKALPKISRPLRRSELSLPDNVDRGFRRKDEKALLKSDNPSREER